MRKRSSWTPGGKVRIAVHPAGRGKTVQPEAVEAAFRAAGCDLMIHGHTHRPADHPVEGLPGAIRQVLSDWHVNATQQRAQVLRLHADGRRERLPS